MTSNRLTILNILRWLGLIELARSDKCTISSAGSYGLIALAVTALIRQLFDPSGFFVVQQAALITLIAGLVIAFVIFVVAIVLTLRRVAAWQQIGAMKSSRAALWSLGITAFVVLLPVLLAIVLPQNPAP